MKIELSKNKEFLKIGQSEVFHFDDFMAFVVVLAAEKAEKFLIDGTELQNTNLSHKERYEIGTSAVLHIDINPKNAVIWPVRDINYFAVSIMRLQGFNIQVLENMSLAKEWLL